MQVMKGGSWPGSWPREASPSTISGFVRHNAFRISVSIIPNGCPISNVPEWFWTSLEMQNGRLLLALGLRRAFALLPFSLLALPQLRHLVEEGDSRSRRGELRAVLLGLSLPDTPSWSSGILREASMQSGRPAFPGRKGISMQT